MKIYLDNNSTTKPLEKIKETYTDSIINCYANPSSSHSAGIEARKIIEEARSSIADMINAESPDEIIFTSGGTESISQTFYAVRESFNQKNLSIIVSAVEHIAVLEAMESSQDNVKYSIKLGVDIKGQLNINELIRNLKEHNPAFVSIMLANNETGVIFPIDEICKICKEYNAILHVDAIQAIGKIPIDVQTNMCNYLSISGHKFYGPKGIGALYVKNGSSRKALIRGHQENNSRGGTENVPGILGMAIAAKSVMKNLNEDSKRIEILRDKLENMILKSFPGSEVNGDRLNRLCNTTNICFPKKDAATLVERLGMNGIYVSAGAACTTGGEPSHVLQAMGRSPEMANSSLRFSLGKFTTEEEIEIAGKKIPEIINSCLDVHSIK